MGVAVWLDYAGVAAFAASSASVSRRRSLDLTATLLLDSIAAIGGGTVRDVLIRLPVFWIVDPLYVVASTRRQAKSSRRASAD